MGSAAGRQSASCLHSDQRASAKLRADAAGRPAAAVGVAGAADAAGTEPVGHMPGPGVPGEKLGEGQWATGRWNRRPAETSGAGWS